MDNFDFQNLPELVQRDVFREIVQDVDSLGPFASAVKDNYQLSHRLVFFLEEYTKANDSIETLVGKPFIELIVVTGNDVVLEWWLNNEHILQYCRHVLEQKGNNHIASWEKTPMDMMLLVLVEQGIPWWSYLMNGNLFKYATLEGQIDALKKCLVYYNESSEADQEIAALMEHPFILGPHDLLEVIADAKNLTFEAEDKKAWIAPARRIFATIPLEVLFETYILQ
jgi:hypothetical protein